MAIKTFQIMSVQSIVENFEKHLVYLETNQA